MSNRLQRASSHDFENMCLWPAIQNFLARNLCVFDNRPKRRNSLCDESVHQPEGRLPKVVWSRRVQIFMGTFILSAGISPYFLILPLISPFSFCLVSFRPSDCAVSLDRSLAIPLKTCHLIVAERYLQSLLLWFSRRRGQNLNFSLCSIGDTTLSFGIISKALQFITVHGPGLRMKGTAHWHSRCA
jgi:hypothetical protein